MGRRLEDVFTIPDRYDQTLAGWFPGTVSLPCATVLRPCVGCGLDVVISTKNAESIDQDKNSRWAIICPFCCLVLTTFSADRLEFGGVLRDGKIPETDA